VLVKESPYALYEIANLCVLLEFSNFWLIFLFGFVLIIFFLCRFKARFFRAIL